MKSILVAVDGSAHSAAAREHAAALARLYGAHVVGLHILDVRVVQMPPVFSSAYVVETPPTSTLPMDILAGFRENGDQLLEEFRAAVAASGVPVELRLEEGVPAQAIAEAAEEHDLLVLGKRGAHARWGEDLLGSTVELVVRKAHTPMLLVERDPRPLRRVVLLFDGSQAAGEALELTADLASHLWAGLEVVTVGSNLEDAGEVQAEARDYLSAFTLPVDYRVFAGDPVLATLEHLDEQPADLVVVGRHGHSRLRSLILGSTTEEILRQVRVPVLVTV